MHLAPDRYSYPPDPHLVGIFHPVLEADWVHDLQARGQELADVFEMKEPSKLHLHLLNSKLELGQIVTASTVEAESLATKIEDEMPPRFRRASTLPIMRTYLYGERNICADVIRPYRPLQTERSIAITTINRETKGTLDIDNSYKFRIALGRVKDNGDANKITGLIAEIVPRRIGIGPGKTKVI